MAAKGIAPSTSSGVISSTAVGDRSRSSSASIGVCSILPVPSVARGLLSRELSPSPDRLSEGPRWPTGRSTVALVPHGGFAHPARSGPLRRQCRLYRGRLYRGHLHRPSITYVLQREGIDGVIPGNSADVPIVVKESQGHRQVTHHIHHILPIDGSSTPHGHFDQSLPD